MNWNKKAPTLRLAGEKIGKKPGKKTATAKSAKKAKTEKKYKVADIKLAPNGEAAMKECYPRMLATRAFCDTYRDMAPFAGMVIVCELHVTKETGVFVRILKDLGAVVRLIPLHSHSVDDGVAAALASSGIEVYAQHGQSLRETRRHREKVFTGTPPDLVIDPSGKLIEVMHSSKVAGEIYPLGVLISSQRAGEVAEDLQIQSKLVCPVLQLHRCVSHSLYGGFKQTAEMMTVALDRMLFAADEIDLLGYSHRYDSSGKLALVVGYGDVGAGVTWALQSHGMEVFVAETDPIRAYQAMLDGAICMSVTKSTTKEIDGVVHQVASSSYSPHLYDVDFLITTTGHKHVVGAGVIKNLNDQAMIINVSDEIEELPASAWKLEELDWNEHMGMPPVGSVRCGYGRTAYVVAKGRGFLPYFQDLSCEDFTDLELAIYGQSLFDIVDQPAEDNLNKAPSIYSKTPKLYDYLARAVIEGHGGQLTE